MAETAAQAAAAVAHAAHFGFYAQQPRDCWLMHRPHVKLEKHEEEYCIPPNRISPLNSPQHNHIKSPRRVYSPRPLNL